MKLPGVTPSRPGYVWVRVGSDDTLQLVRIAGVVTCRPYDYAGGGGFTAVGWWVELPADKDARSAIFEAARAVAKLRIGDAAAQMAQPHGWIHNAGALDGWLAMALESLDRNGGGVL